MNGSEADDTAVVAKPKGYATDSLGRIVVKSLKELAAVPADSTIYLCDLSGQGLDSIPDLSRRKITNLNLSHNKLAWKFSIKQLPKTLQSLNLSHNMLGTLPKEKRRKNCRNTKKETCRYLCCQRKRIEGVKDMCRDSPISYGLTYRITI